MATEEAKSSHHCVINHVDSKLVFPRGVPLTASRSNHDASDFKRYVAHYDSTSDCESFIHVSRHHDVVLFKFCDWFESVQVKLRELFTD